MPSYRKKKDKRQTGHTRHKQGKTKSWVLRVGKVEHKIQNRRTEGWYFPKGDVEFRNNQPSLPMEKKRAWQTETCILLRHGRSFRWPGVKGKGKQGRVG